MREAVAVLSIIAVISILLASVIWIEGYGKDQIKQQAFERGYMVECPGVEGYFWECE